MSKFKRMGMVVSGPICAMAAALIVAMGGITSEGGSRQWFMAALYAALAVVAIVRRVTYSAPSARAQRASRWLAAWPTLIELELAIVLVTSAYVAIWQTGAAGSDLYPLLYVTIAFTATFQPALVVFAAVCVAVMLEMSMVAQTGAMLERVYLHAGVIVGFALLHWAFLRGLIARERRRFHARLAAEIATDQSEVRDFRLIASALTNDSRQGRTRQEQEGLLLRGGARAIRQSAHSTLELARAALNADTAALVWLVDGDRVSTKAACSSHESLLRGNEQVSAGLLAAVMRAPESRLWKSVKAARLPYYEDATHTTSLAVTPVFDGTHMRGLICVDRKVPFRDWEIGTLEAASKHLSQTLESEKLFLAVERAKYEHEKFFFASARLCEALTLEQVMETALDSAAQIAAYDVGALTLYDGIRKVHRVCCLRDEGGNEVIDTRKLLDLEFRSNSGLVSMVVKNRHYLPAGGEVRDNLAHLFTKRQRLKKAGSLVVFPLLSGDKAVGTMVLIAKRDGAFAADVRMMLSVIANQVAVSLENSLMFGRMERMATTDGLTGLTNHRTFQERFEELLDSANRHKRQLSVLLCDVDHFKSVNDTYGHPVGDEVLRRVAAVLKKATRKIDIPARYGGEEFAVVLEATGREGAVQLAERIRLDVAALTVTSDQGPFSVTMSVGVATFPATGETRAQLIERADQALYRAKQTGRNRVIHYDAVPKEKPALAG